MPFVREADLEHGNPAINKVGSPKRRNKQGSEEQDAGKCAGFNFCRKGWIWATIVAGILLGTVIPIGLKARRTPSTGQPQYNFSGNKLNTTILFDPMSGLASNETLTCKMMEPEMPNMTIPESHPPPPLKLLGDRLVTTDGKDVDIHGINWFGFNNGKTMVDGLDAEKNPTWEGGDFATIVQQLKLLGFNAVRLPFLFGDLYTLPPQDYSKRCPAKQPTAEDLASRTTPPKIPKPSAPVPVLSKALSSPPGSQPGTCNAYLPQGASTLARYLWVVQFFVANGFYVLVDYHPEAGKTEHVLDSVDTYTHSWLRLWMGLSCLPNWKDELKGRVFLDLMNEPDGVGITWDAGPKKKTLGDYYLSVMDAINNQTQGDSPLYFIQGAGQEKLGSNWGDGFVTDKKLLQEQQLSDPNPFFAALLSKPYKDHVVLSPHLYGPSLSKTPDIGAPQWDKYAASWGILQKQGYCSSPDASSGKNATAASCQKFPVVIGEVGSNFTLPADKDYFDNLVKFMKVVPPADKYPTTPFNRWFWWVYNANSKEVGGLVGPDWHTLDWKKLQWMQDHLGLSPWYKQQQQQAKTPPK